MKNRIRFSLTKAQRHKEIKFGNSKVRKLVEKKDAGRGAGDPEIQILRKIIYKRR